VTTSALLGLIEDMVISISIVEVLPVRLQEIPMGLCFLELIEVPRQTLLQTAFKFKYRWLCRTITAVDLLRVDQIKTQ